MVNRSIIEIEVIEFIFLKNNIVVINLRINILKYSARKIIANQPPIYSTLNPDTNSDSLSAKSKGLRLVSARHLIVQIINRIEFPKIKGKMF